ncbi:Putative transporter, MFS family [Cupriavidus taiwanensis]|uniref:MFS transporter n=1 Tax=Cupriavidus taiwanensis TaxID=164546 RepID=UPI000E124288|nr:MFS transporter [Cupriavidus taiwanensis]SOZ17371.1 Putative transporter, MFS family [Cupriavidus taiwanensis]SOZ29721.1 Putative transporter, MFS family [Cupriavidus taiwanensis]SOZ46899.1 Putative transporter, MFS family [Cupriavidus taiwanensis]
MPRSHLALAAVASAAPTPAAPAAAGSRYAWLVFALTFALLLSDYMSRQVLNAVFPLLKAEWQLGDAELGALGGVVALMVGVLALPLSLLADRWGRVRSLILMAALWSLATLGCALAGSFGQMFLARLCVGIGEAAYGSVGIAVVVSVFPRHLRASLSAAFIAGGAFGSVLGMGLGGILSAHFGWRMAFAGMAAFGLAMVACYALTISERRLRGLQQRVGAANEDGNSNAATARQLAPGRIVRELLTLPSMLCACAGSALQLLVMAALLAWLPSFLAREYGMATGRAGVVAALLVLVAGAGMVVCGALTDRVARRAPGRKWQMAIAYSAVCCVLLMTAFRLPAGTAQLVLIGAGMLVVGGCAGPASAMVANLTRPAIHATAFATLTLINNLLGLAPGPFLTGVLADRIGLTGALQWIPLAGAAATLLFCIGRRHYAADLRRLDGQPMPQAVPA